MKCFFFFCLVTSPVISGTDSSSGVLLLPVALQIVSASNPNAPPCLLPAVLSQPMGEHRWLCQPAASPSQRLAGAPAMCPHSHKHPEPSQSHGSTLLMGGTQLVHYGDITAGPESAQGHNLGFSHKKRHQMRARKSFIATQLGLTPNSQVMSSLPRKGTGLGSRLGLVSSGRASHSQAVLKHCY